MSIHLNELLTRDELNLESTTETSLRHAYFTSIASLSLERTAAAFSPRSPQNPNLTRVYIVEPCYVRGLICSPNRTGPANLAS